MGERMERAEIVGYLVEAFCDWDADLTDEETEQCFALLHELKEGEDG